MTLNLAETSVVRSRPSVPHGANLFLHASSCFESSVQVSRWWCVDFAWYLRTSSGDIPLTGDPDADADIMAFVQARQKLAQRGTSLFNFDSSSSQSTCVVFMTILPANLGFLIAPLLTSSPFSEPMHRGGPKRLSSSLTPTKILFSVSSLNTVVLDIVVSVLLGL